MKLLELSPEFQQEISKETVSRFGSVSVTPLQYNGIVGEGPVVFVDQQLEPSDVVYQSIEKKCQFLLQKNDGYFDKDLLATARLAEKPQSYFSEKFQFSPEPSLVQETICFETASDKPHLKSKTLARIRQMGSQSLEDSANAIIEELYLNALLDAPREAAKDLKAGEALSVRGPSQIELIQTERFLQISCTDCYGSLDISKLLNRMNDVYRNGAGAMMNMDLTQGAGLGCIILFEHSTCVILGVLPGTQTKVTCLIPLGISNLQRTQMKKSLHWFHGTEV